MAAHARLKNEVTEDERCHNLMSWLKYLSTGENNILVLDMLEVQREPPLCVIGVYMHVRGTTSKEEVQEILAEISEIIFTFEGSHGIVLVCDMNASMLGRQGNERDQMSRVKRICVFEHSVMTHFNCACPAIQRGQGSGFLSEGSS